MAASDRHRVGAWPLAAGVCLIALGAAVLVGWALGWPVLTSLYPGFVSMKPNTALGFILIGAALVLRSFSEKMSRPWSHLQSLAFFASAAATTLAAITLMEYVQGVNLPWIDLLLFVEVTGTPGTSHPGRMAPLTAVAFVILGAVLTVPRGWTREQKQVTMLQGALLIPAFIGFTSVVGYLYGEASFYGIGNYTEIALNTAVGLIIAAGGTLGLLPPGRFGELSRQGSIASVLVRRTLPTVGIAIVGFGWLRLRGETMGFYRTEFGVAVFVMFVNTLMTVLIIHAALRITERDQARKAAEAALEHSREQRAADQDRLTRREKDWHESILNLMPTPLVVIDPETTEISFANRAAEGLAGGPLGRAMPLAAAVAPFRPSTIGPDDCWLPSALQATDMGSVRIDALRGDELA